MIQDLSKSLREDLKGQYTELNDLISPTTMLVIMAYVDAAVGASMEQQNILFQKLQTMHDTTLKPYRKGARTSNRDLSSLWSQWSKYFKDVEGIEKQLDAIEQVQIPKVQALLSERGEEQISFLTSISACKEMLIRIV